MCVWLCDKLVQKTERFVNLTLILFPLSTIKVFFFEFSVTFYHFHLSLFNLFSNLYLKLIYSITVFYPLCIGKKNFLSYFINSQIHLHNSFAHHTSLSSIFSPFSFLKTIINKSVLDLTFNI